MLDKLQPPQNMFFGEDGYHYWFNVICNYRRDSNWREIHDCIGTSIGIGTSIDIEKLIEKVKSEVYPRILFVVDHENDECHASLIDLINDIDGINGTHYLGIINYSDGKTDKIINDIKSFWRKGWTVVKPPTMQKSYLYIDTMVHQFPHATHLCLLKTHNFISQDEIDLLNKICNEDLDGSHDTIIDDIKFVTLDAYKNGYSCLEI